MPKTTGHADLMNKLSPKKLVGKEVNKRKVNESASKKANIMLY